MFIILNCMYVCVRVHMQLCIWEQGGGGQKQRFPWSWGHRWLWATWHQCGTQTRVLFKSSVWSSSLSQFSSPILLFLRCIFMKPRLALTHHIGQGWPWTPESLFQPSECWDTGVCHQTCLMWYWGLNPEYCECWASKWPGWVGGQLKWHVWVTGPLMVGGWG